MAFLKLFVKSAWFGPVRLNPVRSYTNLNKAAASQLMSIPGPQQYPIVGTLPSYWTKYDKLRYNKVLSQLYKEYGPVVKEKFGDKTIVHIFEPEDIKTVYID